MDNCKNAKFCVPTITIEIRNIETIDKSFNQILCFCLPNKKVGKTAEFYITQNQSTIYGYKSKIVIEIAVTAITILRKHT